MRNMLCATALISIALLGAGCKKSPSLVGKWTGTMNGQQAAFEFKDDKSMTIEAKQGPASITFLGDYTLEGEKMTMTLKDVKLVGVPKEMEQMAKNGLKGMLNKPQPSGVKFVSEDEVAFTATDPKDAKGATTEPNKTMTLTRVKEAA